MAVIPDCTDIGEADFESLMVKRCRKFTESEHETEFIPIKEFCLQHVHLHVSPVECEHFIRFVKSCALRTVRVVTRLISKDRSKLLLGANTPGSTLRTVGTGYVTSFSQSFTSEGFIPGQSFYIRTAAHVIYNTEEAQRATVEFFFDDDMDRSQVIVARGVSVVFVYELDDVCQFMCQVDSVSVGDEVRQRMDKIPPLSLPLTLQPGVSFCISHPHGLSQRVSLGEVTSMEVEKIEETRVGKQFLLLVSRCLCEVGIEEKKVLFVLFRDYYVQTYYLPTMSDKQKSELHDIIISHLETQNLIERPTNKEDGSLHNYIVALIDTVKKETDDKCKAKYGSQTFSAGEKKMKWCEIYDETIVDYSKNGNITDDAIDRFRTIDSETWRKISELDIGQQRDVQRIISLAYSTPTCPGSSGALIHVATVGNQGCRHFKGPHSRAGKGGNICAGGIVF